MWQLSKLGEVCFRLKKNDKSQKKTTTKIQFFFSFWKK